MFSSLMDGQVEFGEAGGVVVELVAWNFAFLVGFAFCEFVSKLVIGSFLDAISLSPAAAADVPSTMHRLGGSVTEEFDRCNASFKDPLRFNEH